MKRLIASGAVIIYVVSVIIFCTMIPNESETRATDFGVMCINAVYPTAGIQFADSRDNEEIDGGEGTQEQNEMGEGQGKGNQQQEVVVSNEAGNGEPVVLGDDPQVLILHTHATESYLPASEGNYHSKEEANTVRDVGNVLAQTLEKKGIAVVHDKTLHDYPSYNNSYNRSYETAAALLQKYPTVRCVIDLHRDAIASESTAATVSINGKTCAKYSFVVGTGAATYSNNISFINSLNTVAAQNYSGYTGKVIERGYRYNQDLSSKYLLLEIGYNRNQIDEARNSAEIFGNILADTLKKGN